MNLASQLRSISPKHRLAPGATVHIAVMAGPFLSLLLSGKKTMESRFSKNKIAPYGKIKKGDVVFLKAAAGPVVGLFRAGEVRFIELDNTELERLKNTYSSAICADGAFWELQKEKRYATLVEVTELMTLPPTKIAKTNRLGWMTVLLAA